MSFKQKSKKLMLEHMVDSTAIATVVTPIFASFEKLAMGTSDDVSINARLLGAGLLYGGMGTLFSKGRSILRNKLGITQAHPERVQRNIDRAYTTGYNLAICPAFYYIAGSRSINEIAIGTGISVGFSLLSGGMIGYAVDGFRDLAGLENSERLSTRVQKMPPTRKKGLAAALVAGSMALTSLPYLLTQDKEARIVPAQETRAIEYTPAP